MSSNLNFDATLLNIYAQIANWRYILSVFDLYFIFCAMFDFELVWLVWDMIGWYLRTLESQKYFHNV